jgi:hypothetical protein
MCYHGVGTTALKGGGEILEKPYPDIPQAWLIWARATAARATLVTSEQNDRLQAIVEFWYAVYEVSKLMGCQIRPNNKGF